MEFFDLRTQNVVLMNLLVVSAHPISNHPTFDVARVAVAAGLYALVESILGGAHAPDGGVQAFGALVDLRLVTVKDRGAPTQRAL
jgi:hypothetical protein